MSELKITKEAVLAAAAKCSTAKETLKTLFPDVFEEEKKPLVPDDWILRHPNGLTVMGAVSAVDKSNHIHLLANEFDFEIVESHGFKYLKVTPIQNIRIR